MKPQYREGEEVKKEFERTMTKIFRAPKPEERKQPKPSESKKSEADKD